MINKVKTKRRIFVFLIVLVAVIAVWIMPFGKPSCSAQVLENPEEFFVYTITDDEATITGIYYPALPWDFDGHLFIPETLDGYPVTAIANETFLNWQTDLTEVTIPQSIVSIGGGAFANCRNLTKVTFDYDYDEAGLESIGNSAFSQCDSLESIVMLIDDDYSIPNSVTSIGQNAFFGCSALEKISIPSGLTTIEDNTFFGCSSLTRVIESYAGSSLATIGSGAFHGCNLQFYYIPESVTSIGDAAFYNCSNLFATSIPNGVTALEDNTFYNCSSLRNLTWSYENSQVTSIGYGAFILCTNLSNVFGESSFIIPKSVVSIGGEAFYSCSNISDIIISDNVTSIADNTFTLHNENLRIHGFEGSYPQTYADDHSIDFVALSPVSPSAVSFDKNPSMQADVSTDKTLASAAQVTDVKNGETSIGAGNFSYSGNTLTIKKEYLLLQELGILELTVVFDNGVTGILTINISDSGPAVISPNIGSFIEGAEADVPTVITWHSAASVSAVKAGAVPLTYGDDYTVTNDDGTTAVLTIKKEYLQMKPEGSLILNIEFDTGDLETLTISIKTNDPVQNPNAGIFPETEIFYQTSPEDVTTTIIWNQASSITDITEGGTSIGVDNYAVTDNDGYTAILTIKKEYLETQAVGSIELNINFNKGNPETFIIDISEITPVVDAVINPVSANYDLNAPDDVSTNIIWNSASTITDVVYNSTSLNSGTDYTRTGSALTIQDSFLSDLMPSVNDTLVFEICFDTGSPATLTVNVVESYIPSDDADLSGLTVGGSTISGFDPSVEEYYVELPFGTLPGSAAATVSATANESNAHVDITQAAVLPGSAAVVVTAEDMVTSKMYTINFTLGSAPIAPSITTTSLSDGEVNEAYNQTLSATGDTPITWSIESGSLPDGLTLNESTGIIGGTPTADGTFTFTVQAQNSTGSDTQALSITINPVSIAPSITTTSLSDGEVNEAYNQTLSATGDTPITWSIESGSLPDGLTLNESTGIIGGTPTADGTFTFTVQAQNSTGSDTQALSITIEPLSNGGNSGGSSGRSGSSDPKYSAKVTENGKKGSDLSVTVDKRNDTATVEIGGKNKFSDGGETIITVPRISGVHQYGISISADHLTGSNDEGTLTLNTEIGNITIPGNMLTGSDADKGKTEIIIGQGNKSDLTDEVKDVIGDRPLVQLTMTIDGKQKDWNNPHSPVTVSIPYTPTAEELKDPEHITVWYIDGSGNAIEVPSGRYDPETGTVTFNTTHFSDYAVVFVEKTFEDLESVAWAKEQIEILASKGILRGISEKEYAPQTDITRADFLYFLVRTLDVDAKFDENFEDIKSGAYYYDEIAIAKELGITRGTGDNKFNPNSNITRQDMMVLTERTLRMLNKIENRGLTSDLEIFGDKSLIADYAMGSMASLVKEGLIEGDGEKIHPLGNTTRAEAAVFLYRIYNK